ncbi:MAG: TetR family transcriptional regulator [Myxococcales bacterium]|nr:TetR family transcriptional regulator [Myxococcales bacterium]
MARPSSYTERDLLDIAVALAAEGGAAAVSVAGVARLAGAPSGSVYHRFAGRSALLARVWLHALTSFEDAWWSVAEHEVDPGAVAAAPLRWARSEPQLAAILARHGRRSFVEGPERATIEAHEARLLGRWELLSARFLGDASPESLARTRFALATVPLAAIRDRSPEDLVVETARLLLGVR